MEEITLKYLIDNLINELTIGCISSFSSDDDFNYCDRPDEIGDEEYEEELEQYIQRNGEKEVRCIEADGYYDIHYLSITIE